MRKIIVLLALLLCTGCATPYQQIDENGGYYHQRSGEDFFTVGFQGNEYTDYKTAKDFAILRTAEICKQLGYTHFAVEGQTDRSKTGSTQSFGHTSGSIYSNTYFGNTYYSSIPEFYPHIVITARFFEGEPTGRYLEIFVANQIIENIKEKHDI